MEIIGFGEGSRLSFGMLTAGGKKFGTLVVEKESLKYRAKIPMSRKTAHHGLLLRHLT